jgi:hypothetical protein
VTGFPPDVRGRELHNLMRYLPGYEACQLTWKGAEPQVGTCTARRHRRRGDAG